MINLSTSFAGLSLNNPIVVSSCGLTNTASKNKALEEAGAAAIVLKSIFEEQIMMHANHLETNNYPEGQEYLDTYVRSHSVNEHINLIKESKKLCSIPIIASINCFDDKGWTDFALNMQEAGADALELNILTLETDKYGAYGVKEQKIIKIVHDVKQRISIPIIVKLGYFISNPVALITQLYANGVAGVVLFNRTYQTDIDIDNMTYTTGDIFSSTSDLCDRLRWTAISSFRVPGIDLAVSGGIHSGVGAIKAILAGAKAADICSILYKKGNSVIKEMLREIEVWMDIQGFTSIKQFKGRMNIDAAGDINPFERTQFMKYYGTRE